MSGRNWSRKSCQQESNFRFFCVRSSVAYLILWEGQVHIVVKPMVEHLHCILSQLSNAVWPHGHGLMEPYQTQKGDKKNG